MSLIFLSSIILCSVRIAYLQTVKCADARKEIEEARILAPVSLPTVRGSILDRNGKYLAVDEPVFYLRMDYKLTWLLDERFWRVTTMQYMKTKEGITAEEAETAIREKYYRDIANIMNVIDMCARIAGIDKGEIEVRIREINDRIWSLREYIAWSRNFPESALKEEFKAKGRAVPAWLARADFASRMPDEKRRFALTVQIKLKEMEQNHPLIELKGHEQLLVAQQEFAGIDGVTILPEAKRIYPYNSSASQIIGWVGAAQKSENELFGDDIYSRYLTGEVSGRGNGAEEVCEVILRGQRGQVVYDKDKRLLNRKETCFGRDVKLSIDIELQKNIERYLSSVRTKGEEADEIGAVVLDVATNEILAMVSIPVYDLNTVRREYNNLTDAAGKPFESKAIYETYPVGSVIKPVILLAGLEEGKITPDEIIPCPHSRAPRGWPNCITFRKFGNCHDWKWPNIARNAIKGSCNRYFSVLADRLNSVVLQKWLYMFGYGRKILPAPDLDEMAKGLDRVAGMDRNLSQSAGIIASTVSQQRPPKSFEQVPSLMGSEKRHFGIGQGSFRVTVLQVANAMGTIARGGIYKSPRLFLSESDPLNIFQTDLGISDKHIEVVRDGMRAVANESGGTAYKVFADSELIKSQVKVFGKTGSTETPYHAWFAGFAEDPSGRAISFAIIVEGGASGAGDAAPLAEKILCLCVKAGYIGHN